MRKKSIRSCIAAAAVLASLLQIAGCGKPATEDRSTAPGASMSATKPASPKSAAETCKEAFTALAPLLGVLTESMQVVENGAHPTYSPEFKEKVRTQAVKTAAVLQSSIESNSDPIVETELIRTKKEVDKLTAGVLDDEQLPLLDLADACKKSAPELAEIKSSLPWPLSEVY